MELDIIQLILQEFKPQNEEQKKLKTYMEKYKATCENYINSSYKYKERLICLKSIYHSIKMDLLADINAQIYQ